MVGGDIEGLVDVVGRGDGPVRVDAAVGTGAGRDGPGRFFNIDKIICSDISTAAALGTSKSDLAGRIIFLYRLK